MQLLYFIHVHKYDTHGWENGKFGSSFETFAHFEVHSMHCSRQSSQTVSALRPAYSYTMQFIVFILVLAAGLVSASKNLRTAKPVPPLPIKLASGTPSPSAAEKQTATQKLAAAPQDNASMRLTATVDVYFHIMMTTDGQGVITDGQVDQQMQVLRDAFHGVKFNLKPVARITNDVWHYAAIGSTEEMAMKAQLRQGGADALNIYTGNPPIYWSWGVFPFTYATNPSYDGIVLDYRVLPGGLNPNYDRGFQLVHQVGHWMGLYNTYEGGCAHFGTDGDEVRDTPAAGWGTSYDCMPVDSCPGVTRGEKGEDLIHNFMAGGYDSCADSFTQGQRDRMRAMWRVFRGPTPAFSN